MKIVRSKIEDIYYEMTRKCPDKIFLDVFHLKIHVESSFANILTTSRRDARKKIKHETSNPQ